MAATEATRYMKVMKWISYIVIPSLLIAALLLAKPHEAKPEQHDDRLQWSAKATAYTPLIGAAMRPMAPEGLSGAKERLYVPPRSLDASLQVSLRLKPAGAPDSRAVNPSGSGTLTIRGAKYSFLVDSTSQLNRYRLSDGTVYLGGSLGIIVSTPDGEEQAVLGVGSILGSPEGEWTYTNPDGQGVIRFGPGFSAAHAADIAAKP
jgi:hypothetical protein